MGKPGYHPPPQYLVLGQVTRPHGVRGELRVRLITDYPERIGTLQHVYAARNTEGKDARQLTVEGMRMNKGVGLLKVEEVNDRDAADRLRRMYVLVPLEDAIPLEKDEFYLFQVIGMTVKTEDDKTLGTVTSVIETGANDVYVLDSPTYGEVLFPITVETLITHDLETGIVWVNIPNGLLPDNTQPT